MAGSKRAAKATSDGAAGGGKSKTGPPESGSGTAGPSLLLRALAGVLIALAMAWARGGGLFDTVLGPARNEQAQQQAQAQQQEHQQEHQQEQEVEMAVALVNEWHNAVSVFWEKEEDEWVQVIPSLRGETAMNTFSGHRFMFAQEGTRDQVGEVVQMKVGTTRYTLPADAKRKVEVDGPCTDRFPGKCARLAKAGECQNNPGWMIVNCPQSCESCELLDSKKRCSRDFLNISSANEWHPGDLNAMFERIMRDFPQYSPVAVSQPPDGPWVVQFEDFLSDAEVERMIKWGYDLGFQRSTDVGAVNERGEAQKVVSQHRTSSNAWCAHECEKDPVIMGVTAKIEALTAVPRNNYESFQLLKYTKGQYYRTHHDMAPSERHEASGPRTLTFFLYLSDVEEGGETHFPKVAAQSGGLKVRPAKGRAILWPSVLDEDPRRQDPRTSHAALPVGEGVKYASNHWIHLNDFRKANLWGCTGSFD